MSIQMPSSSLPSSMIDAYANIRVTLPGGGSTTVCVQRYACQHAGYGRGQNERMAMKDRVLGAMRSSGGFAAYGLTASRFVGVFSGKGTIDDIATCLSFMAAHGIFRHDRARPGDAQRSMAVALQTVADDYLGLDCNGFVGNWAIYNNVPRASASYLPLDWVPGRTVRRSLADIQPYDIVVWASGTHIGMVESLESLATNASTRRVNFAESSRGGMLNHRGTELRALRSPVNATGRNFQACFSLHSDIHGNDNVVVASMAHR